MPSEFWCPSCPGRSFNAQKKTTYRLQMKSVQERPVPHAGYWSLYSVSPVVRHSPSRTTKSVPVMTGQPPPSYTQNSSVSLPKSRLPAAQRCSTMSPVGRTTPSAALPTRRWASPPSRQCRGCGVSAAPEHYGVVRWCWHGHPIARGWQDCRCSLCTDA